MADVTTETMQMVELLPDSPATTPQDHARKLLRATLVPPTECDPRAVLFTAEDAVEFVRDRLEPVIGRILAGKPIWLRFYRADSSAGLLVALHGFASPGEMELSVLADPGMVTRTALRFIAEWAFVRLCLLRVVARVPVEDRATADLLRRVGFRHESTARGYFIDGGDASVWAMTAERCRWLPEAPSFAPDLTPPTSDRRH